MSNPITGTVKWYSPDKGYGFITIEADRDVFVHRRAIADGRPWLIDGQEVAMRIEQGLKGPEAAEVRVTKDVAEPRAYGGHVRSSDQQPRARDVYRGPVPRDPIVATVVRVDPAGRYMFVKANVAGFDVYVHNSLFQNLHDMLHKGDQVRITVEEGDRGLRARSIELI